MERAQIAMAKKFFSESLGMPADELAKCGSLKVCSTDADMLLVKFGSVSQARLVNSYKKNLPKELQVDDFIPPCLVEWENVLVEHGNRLRS